jgi:hypothetical protein
VDIIRRDVESLYASPETGATIKHEEVRGCLRQVDVQLGGGSKKS